LSTAIQWLTGEGRKNLIASKEHQTDFRFVFWSQNVRIKPILRVFSSPPKPRVAGSIPSAPAKKKEMALGHLFLFRSGNMVYAERLRQKLLAIFVLRF